MLLGITKLAVQELITDQGRSLGYAMSVMVPDGREFAIDISEGVYTDLATLCAQARPEPEPEPEPEPVESLEEKIESMNPSEMQQILAELGGGSVLNRVQDEAPVPIAENVQDLFAMVHEGPDLDEPEPGLGSDPSGKDMEQL